MLHARCRLQVSARLDSVAKAVARGHSRHGISTPLLGASIASQRHARRLSTMSSTAGSEAAPLGRSYLYVPATAERMLEKSLTTNSDVIIYDLEDSVPPSPADKNGARGRLTHFLSTRLSNLPSHERIAVRLNSNSTPFFAEDILQAMRLPCIRTLVLPKVHSVQDLNQVSEEIFLAYKGHKFRDPDGPPVRLVASIESARAMYNLGDIASWQSQYGDALGGKLSALLFAAEDYCADTGIIRTTSRQELLYTRSHIVVTAKAFGLQAIDMVCVNYKDLEYLRNECEDGRRLGFTGKASRLKVQKAPQPDPAVHSKPFIPAK
ncbi:hypothetical protein NUW54_g11267 [Trametes sanguinea]|uniref:Uncharacterized protein n=1 Tax=Trametes sanguinea TaxID=158606 RepID=A0ACC1NGV7_9APHY|nr:hypothetical protein NUW54_g11267 [Trametes sanguinea]